MQDMMVKIADGITEMIPAAMGFPMVPGTPLNLIPEWDSMMSVNFKVFLEETFGVRIPEDLLEGDSTMGDVIEFIRRTD